MLKPFGFLFLLIFVPFTFGLNFSQSSNSPYQLDLKKDGIACGAIALLAGAGWALEQQVNPLTTSNIEVLKSASVNGFDRSATQQWSLAAKKTSDVTVAVCIASPLLFGFSGLAREDWWTVAVLYFETMGAANALAEFSKGSVLRTRPFVYNNEAPMDAKLEADAHKSFFSNHSSNAFASAVFCGTLFNDYFPQSDRKWMVWSSALTVAAGTGFLRYKAGKHFPTDILTGAAVGSTVGALVPFLHRKKSKTSLSLGEKNQLVFTRTF